MRPQLPTEERPWFGSRVPGPRVGANRLSWEAGLCLVLVASGAIWGTPVSALLALLPFSLLMFAIYKDTKYAAAEMNDRGRIFSRHPKGLGKRTSTAALLSDEDRPA